MLQTAGDPRSGHWCVTVSMKKSEMDHGIRCNMETRLVCKEDVKDDGNVDTWRIHSPRRDPLAIFYRAGYVRHRGYSKQEFDFSKSISDAIFILTLKYQTIPACCNRHTKLYCRSDRRLLAAVHIGRFPNFVSEFSVLFLMILFYFLVI